MITIMSDLTSALERLARDTVVLGAGCALFRAGDVVVDQYVVQSGCVHLVRFDAQGGVVVMQRATRGMVLAESSLFAESYHCSAVAVADAVLLRVPRRDLRQAIDRDPDLMRAVALHLAHEVHRMRIRVEVLSKKTVRERFDAWLALGNGQWPARGEMAAVANDIGVSPEAFYRELQRRRRAG